MRKKDCVNYNVLKTFHFFLAQMKKIWFLSQDCPLNWYSFGWSALINQDHQEAVFSFWSVQEQLPRPDYPLPLSSFIHQTHSGWVKQREGLLRWNQSGTLDRMISTYSMLVQWFHHLSHVFETLLSSHWSILKAFPRYVDMSKDHFDLLSCWEKNNPKTLWSTCPVPTYSWEAPGWRSSHVRNN